MKLSGIERLLLRNQFEILAHLSTDHEYYERAVKIVEEGYELHYPELVERFTETLTTDECAEVVNILDLHEVLQLSYKQLDDNTGVDDFWIQFQGFSGNEETRQMAYAEFFVRDMKRFTNLELGNDGFNSHFPMLEKYRRMLQVWMGFGKKRTLSAV